MRRKKISFWLIFGMIIAYSFSTPHLCNYIAVYLTINPVLILIPMIGATVSIIKYYGSKITLVY